jgi:hypothetical protein
VPSSGEIVVALLAACSALCCRPKSQLAGIAKPQLSVSLRNTVRVMVMSSEAPFTTSDCPLLAPDTRATLNDAPLQRLKGMQSSDDFAYNRDCLLELAGPLSSVPRDYPAASLRVWDDSTSWRWEVPAAFVPRSFEFAYPSQAVSKRGDRVALLWSPPTDDLDSTRIAFELLRKDARPGTGTPIRNPEIGGASLEFAIPSPGGPDEAWSGPGVLRLLGTNGVEPAREECPVESCSLNLDLEVPSLPITITD